MHGLSSKAAFKQSVVLIETTGSSDGQKGIRWLRWANFAASKRESWGNKPHLEPALAFPTRGQVASQWLLDSTGDQTELFSNSAVVENLICSSNPSWCIPCKGPTGACAADGIAAVAPMPAAVVHHLHSAAMLLLTWVALTTIYSFLSHFSSFLYPFPVFLNLVGQGMYQ